MQMQVMALAQAITGKPLELTHSLPITEQVVLYRFALGATSDWLHILIDGTGGFEAIRYPGTDDARTVRRGALAEFLDIRGGMETADHQAVTNL